MPQPPSYDRGAVRGAAPQGGAVDDWRRTLLRARQDAGFGRKRLAELAGISVETIRGYEIGRRHPRNETLESMITALGLDRGRANVIREAAGFAPVRTGFGGATAYYFTLDEAASAVERSPWPRFAVDDVFDIVAANKPVRALWGVRSIEQERGRGGRSMNIFAFMARRDLARHIVNWDDIVEATASYFKGRPVVPAGEAEDEVLAELLLEPFRDHDARFLERTQAAWKRAKPVTPKVRWEYQVQWRVLRGSTIRFNAFVSPANERDGLVFNDWIPVDTESWRRLQNATSPRA